MVSEQQCCQILSFRYIYWKFLPKPWEPSRFWEHKTLEGTKKNKILVPKRWRVPNKTKKNKVLEHWVAWQLKTPKLFFWFLLVFSSVLAPKLRIFWCLHGFGKLCSKMLEVPKTPIRPWVLKICESAILSFYESANLRIVDSGNFVCIQKRYLKLFCWGRGDEQVILLYWYNKNK